MCSTKSIPGIECLEGEAAGYRASPPHRSKTPHCGHTRPGLRKSQRLFFDSTRATPFCAQLGARYGR